MSSTSTKQTSLETELIRFWQKFFLVECAPRSRLGVPGGVYEIVIILETSPFEPSCVGSTLISGLAAWSSPPILAAMSGTASSIADEYEGFDATRTSNLEPS